MLQYTSNYIIFNVPFFNEPIIESTSCESSIKLFEYSSDDTDIDLEVNSNYEDESDYKVSSNIYKSSNSQSKNNSDDLIIISNKEKE